MIMKLTSQLVMLAILAPVPSFAQTAAKERDRMVNLAALLAAPLLPPVVGLDAPPSKKPAATAHEDEGERIFAQNCSRCHNAPEGFSPSIAGTVVRHMRVRASLSRHDEELLLKFFNP